MATIKLKDLDIKEVKYCKSSFSQGLGLMFSSRNNSRALVFELKKAKKVPLHMFFVFYPIDVLYVDEVRDGGNKRVKKIVEIKENFKPFTFYFPKKKAKYVVELAANSVSKWMINLDDSIRF